MGSSPPFPPSEGEERDRGEDLRLTHFLSWPWEVQLLLNVISLFLSLLMLLIYLCAYFALIFCFVFHLFRLMTLSLCSDSAEFRKIERAAERVECCIENLWETFLLFTQKQRWRQYKPGHSECWMNLLLDYTLCIMQSNWRVWQWWWWWWWFDCTIPGNDTENV